MISLGSYTAPPGPCGYLPDREWQMQYEFVAEATAAEYEARLLAGWRRFGRTWFRPRCPSCSACRSLRVDVAKFRPDRSQRRNRRANEGEVTLRIGPPEVAPDKLDLYDRYHQFQIDAVGWNARPPKDAAEYYESFVDNPFVSEEWNYFLRGRLAGVGFVDVVPSGLSAIYFFHQPHLRSHGLGVWNVLQVIEEARRRGLPWVYLGYFVAGYRSLEYKGRYGPSEALDWSDMRWKPFDGVPPAR